MNGGGHISNFMCKHFKLFCKDTNVQQTRVKGDGSSPDVALIQSQEAQQTRAERDESRTGVAPIQSQKVRQSRARSGKLRHDVTPIRSQIVRQTHAKGDGSRHDVVPVQSQEVQQTLHYVVNDNPANHYTFGERNVRRRLQRDTSCDK